MIPYIAIPELHLGPFTLSPFGLLAAAGILTATHILTTQAKKEGLSPEPLADYAIWGVGAGVVFGHFFHLFAYHPEELERGGVLQIFKVWDGLSSFGGLLGGIIAAAVYFRVKKLSFHTYGDAFALAVAPGWAIARLGCFAVHDHPGRLTSFFLAVKFPWGTRHDLGLYDALLLFALTGLLFALRRAGAMRARLLPLLALLYAIGRFFEDFLRATDLSYVDKRYFGLTPAQYSCFALVAYGIWGSRRSAPKAPGPGRGGDRPREEEERPSGPSRRAASRPPARAGGGAARRRRIRYSSRWSVFRSSAASSSGIGASWPPRSRSSTSVKWASTSPIAASPSRRSSSRKSASTFESSRAGSFASSRSAASRIGSGAAVERKRTGIRDRAVGHAPDATGV